MNKVSLEVIETRKTGAPLIIPYKPACMKRCKTLKQGNKTFAAEIWQEKVIKKKEKTFLEYSLELL